MGATGKVLAAGGAVVALGIGAMLAALGGNELIKSCSNPYSYVQPAAANGTGVSSLFKDPEQQANAKIIVGVGQARGISRRLIKVALMVAMQESNLRNLSGGDADSIGLFQQRPSQGWGSPTQLKDPVYATNKFYDAVEKVKNPDAKSLLDIAVEVQRPAKGAYLSPAHYFPGWEVHAEKILGNTSSGAGGSVVLTSAMMPTEDCAKFGFGGTAEMAVQAALSQQGKPYLFGSSAATDFDGGEFMQWAYGQAGVSLPLLASQLYQHGTVVGDASGATGDPAAWLSVLERGDLLYWGSKPSDPGSISHVAMYLGDGKMIDAPQAGATISMKPVQWKFGQLSYVGATRPTDAASSAQLTPNGGWRWPLDHITVTSKFGMRFHPTQHVWMLHDGVDFVATLNEPVRAAADGVTTTSTGRGFGNQITIDHGGGVKTGYAHLNKFAFGMNFPGVKVKAGQIIGYAGTTGWSTGVHLHFKTIVNGTPIDPLKYMRTHGLVP